MPSDGKSLTVPGYAEVRGKVTSTMTGSRAREQIDELAHKYIDKDYPPEGIKSERVIL